MVDLCLHFSLLHPALTYQILQDALPSTSARQSLVLLLILLHGPRPRFSSVPVAHASSRHNH